jgi:glucokinase
MSIIGIDLGGTKILGVRASKEGEIAEELRVETRGEEGLEAVVDRIAKMVLDLMPGEGEGPLEGIGVGVPGPLNPTLGVVYHPPNLPGWEEVPLRDMLRERLQLSGETPIVLVNDANAAALAEYMFGAGCERELGRPIRHLVYLTISTGVGGGVITDGRLLLGVTGMAAELGHIVLDADGSRCFCGGRGHFEGMASGTALAREGFLVVSSRRETIMADLVEGDADRVTAEIVVEAAQKGDREALALMQRESFLVGVGVVSCVHAFNPEVIVIGGGVSNAGSLLFDGVRSTADELVMPAYRGTFEIVPAALAGTSGALGAVAAVLASSE